MKRFIFGLIVGLGVGGTASYFITSKFVKEAAKEDADARADEEIAKMREYWRKKNEPEEKEEVNEDEESEKEKIARKNHVNAVPDKPIPKEYKNLTRTYAADDGIDRSDTGVEEDEEYEEEDEADSEHPEDDTPDIELISAGEFGDGFEENILLYYIKDHALAYDNEELVDNIHYLLGGFFGEWANDEVDSEDLYVRNHKIHEDFCVKKVDGAYSDLFGED